MVGLFLATSARVIDTDTLTTLPEREYVPVGQKSLSMVSSPSQKLFEYLDSTARLSWLKMLAR